MDRGRVGLDVVGNRSIREAALRKRRRDHLERLKKIRQRQPGDSPTLDNVLSEDLLGFHNSRRVIAEAARGEVVERENKALLQRISKILTAPAKINSDEEYWKMKKLFVRTNANEKYEKEVLEKKQAEVFERINATGAYYNHKVWEDDYQRQLKGQKFMRQVRYKRPKDFVDPFAPASSDEKDDRSRDGKSRSRSRSKERTRGGATDEDEYENDEYGDEDFEGANTNESKNSRSGRHSEGKSSPSADRSKSASHHKKPSSSKHVNRIRNLHHESEATTSASSAGGGGDKKKASSRPSTHSHSSSTSAQKKGSVVSMKKQSSLHGRAQDNSKSAATTSSSTHNDDDEAVFGAIDIYAPRLLAHVHRNLKITDGDNYHDAKPGNNAAAAKRVLTDVQCWRKGVPSNEIRRWERSRSYSAISLNDYGFGGGSESPSRLGSSASSEQNTNIATVQIITLSAELLEGSESLSCTMWLDIKKLVDAWVFEKGVEDTWGLTAEEIGVTYSSTNESIDASNTSSSVNAAMLSDQKRDSVDRQASLLQEMAKDIVSNLSLSRTETLTPSGTNVTLEMVLPEYVTSAELTRIDVSSRADAAGSNKAEKSYRAGADFRKQSIFEQLDEHANEDGAEEEYEFRDEEPPKPAFKCGVRLPFEVRVGENNTSSSAPHTSHMHSMPVLHSIAGLPSHQPPLGLASSTGAIGVAAGSSSGVGGFGSSSMVDTGSTSAGGRKSSTIIPLVPAKEHVYVLMKMQDAGDDKAQITAHLIDSFSSAQLRHTGKRTTLPAGSVFTTTVPLPTIMAIDHELVNEFFMNLKSNFRLLYDRNNAMTTLCLREEDQLV